MRILTAGESHGKQLTGIIEGLPAGILLDEQKIRQTLQNRQQGHGRGLRMKIESDDFEIVSGVRSSMTTGAPLTIVIRNKDSNNWLSILDAWNKENTIEENKSTPRPGHADLAGAIKYGTKDLRNIIERSSARETAMRVAIGAICDQILAHLEISINSDVINVGKYQGSEMFDQIQNYIDEVRDTGDTIGGKVKVSVENLPIGFGDFMHYDNRLDAHLAFAIMSIQAAKGVTFGNVDALSSKLGSEVHDQITWDQENGYSHLSNNCGGIVGGMANGENVEMTIYVKPIPTLKKPLQSVNLQTHELETSFYERSDVSVLSAFAVVAKAMTAIKLCEILFQDYTHTQFDDVKNNIEIIRERALKF